LLELHRLETDVKSDANVTENDGCSASKLESTFLEFQRLAREVEKARLIRDSWRRAASDEKQKSEEAGKKLAEILGGGAEQVMNLDYHKTTMLFIKQCNSRQKINYLLLLSNWTT
jgi:hypothetical protein